MKDQVAYTIRIKPDTDEMIKKACEIGNITKSEFVRAALEMALYRFAISSIVNHAQRDHEST